MYASNKVILHTLVMVREKMNETITVDKWTAKRNSGYDPGTHLKPMHFAQSFKDLLLTNGLRMQIEKSVSNIEQILLRGHNFPITLIGKISSISL